jgi:hypothetical protein
MSKVGWLLLTSYPHLSPNGYFLKTLICLLKSVSWTNELGSEDQSEKEVWELWEAVEEPWAFKRGHVGLKEVERAS